jgi:hypothetical protein
VSCYRRKEIAVVRGIDTKVVVLGHDMKHEKHWLWVVWPNTRRVTRVDPFDLIKLRVFEAAGGTSIPFPKPPRRIEGWE